MIKTSTLSSLQPPTQTVKLQEEPKLPDFGEPSEATINNILSYSHSLRVMESEMVKSIEIVNQ